MLGAKLGFASPGSEMQLALEGGLPAAACSQGTGRVRLRKMQRPLRTAEDTREPRRERDRSREKHKLLPP